MTNKDHLAEFREAADCYRTFFEAGNKSKTGHQVIAADDEIERLTAEIQRKDELLREVYDWQHKWKETYLRIESAVEDLGLIIARIGDEITVSDKQCRHARRVFSSTDERLVPGQCIDCGDVTDARRQEET